MFDHVVLRRSEGGTAISAGQIAETLLFYQIVHLVIDRQTLLGLVHQIGPSGLLALVARPDFSAVYAEETLCTVTNSVSVSKCYDFAACTLAKSAAGNNLKTPNERLGHDLHQAGVPRAHSKKVAEALLERVPVRKMSGNHFVHGGIPKATRCDLNNSEYLNTAFSEIIAHLLGGYRPRSALTVEVIKGRESFFVFDNIDYGRVNHNRAEMNPPLEAVTTAHLLSHLQDARADLALAAHYGGDFVTSAVTSLVIRLQVDTLLRRSEINARAKREFAEVMLPDMLTVAEQVDSGERSFQEFLVLLDKSAKFREWLKSTNPDEGLVREYLRAISSQDLIQTSKSKGIRYLLTLAADATNPVAGFAAGLIDNFLIEKLLSGWRPNHFINKRLAHFLRRQGATLAAEARRIRSLPLLLTPTLLPSVILVVIFPIRLSHISHRNASREHRFSQSKRRTGFLRTPE